jgi:Domain of unknown function (DUF4192)
MTTQIAGTEDLPLRLSSAGDIVEAVPFLIGFQPENSLVVLSLRGSRSRLGLTARIDLPTAAQAEACAIEFADYLTRDHAARAIVVLYPPSDGPLHPSVEPLARALTDYLSAERIAIAEIICVCDGLWWSMLCLSAQCCPRQGTPVDKGGTSANAAAMTFHGKVVLSSREELARTLDPVNGVARALMIDALPRARLQTVERIVGGHHDEVVAESLDLFRAAVRDRMPVDDAVEAVAKATLSVADVARLIVGLDDWRARDELLTWFEDDRGHALRELLVEMVRRGNPLEAAPSLTTLAWISYLQGEGAFARIALDRALAIDPDYSLAQLLDQALLKGLNPDTFRKSTLAMSGRISPRRPSASRRKRRR